MDLLPTEQVAKDFVIRIGLDRAKRVLGAICRRFDRRFEKASKAASAPINREWIRRTDLEINLTHKLKQGIGLVDDSNCPARARERNLQRRLERKKRRAAIRCEVV